MRKMQKTYYWFLNYAYHVILYRLQLQDMNEYVMDKANEKIKTSHV